ncbi:MAG: 5-deoxy-glucuronate isomerase [Thermaerobacter sp.]|nr:5-deoxy-glucuronate isomerase [Thermaerobacter sp.]
MLKYVPATSPSEGPVLMVTPETAPVHYVGTAVYRLAAGQRFQDRVGRHQERALVLLSGQARVLGDGLPDTALKGRAAVFEETPPYVVYVTSGAALSLVAETDCELLWASAALDEPASLASRIYTPAEMPIEFRGEGVTGRQVRHLLEEPGQAVRLRLVEVITPGGHWSSFPPHKHDRDIPGVESCLEEIYYYHMAPAKLWAFQRVYDQTGWGEALAVSDGDLVVVPRGYHPVSAPPGSTVYYLNVMAGPTRQWLFTTDPAFAHVPGFSVPGERRGTS